MARVDFSNATIEFLNKLSFQNSIQYWGLAGGGGSNFNNLFDAEGTIITSGNVPVAVASAKGFTVTRTGTFTASGTEFYIRMNATPQEVCRISNIVFREGDTYSFDIKIDTP